MNKRLGVVSVVAVLAIALFALSVWATNGEIYLSSDKNGQNRVTNVQEGDEVWIAVYDPDENIDCDIRDKIWTDIKIMDPKTGAYIVWMSLPDEVTEAEGWDLFLNGAAWANRVVPHRGHWPGNNAGSLLFDYLEETGADTGLFVSKRSFQIGARVDWNDPLGNTHVVDNTRGGPGDMYPTQFQGGNWGYWFGAVRGAIYATPGLEFAIIPDMMPPFVVEDIFTNLRDLPSVLPPPWFEDQVEGGYLLGRFENMDTLVLKYLDQNDDTDVAIGMAKIIDTEATITWGQEVYKDANTSATITVVDADENLNCNEIEYVPVFILVNPGSWIPVDAIEEPDGIGEGASATNFCMLKIWGGVDPDGVIAAGIAQPYGDYPFDGEALRFYNMYDSGLPNYDLLNDQPIAWGSYYVQYPTPLNDAVDGDWDNVQYFDTANENGLARVMFFAQETGVDSGVFQLNLNSLLVDLGFDSLRVRDVLVAYYLDPNDEDDFKLATAYIEERQHSIVSFTDAERRDKEVFWIGRDPVYVQVIDSNANVDPCCPEQVVVHICDVHNEDDVEWLILDETSSNSPVFFTNGGVELDPVWDAMGIGAGLIIGYGNVVGGYQLVLDNWKLEVYNEDDLYVRYNDVYYETGIMGMNGIGDANPMTAMPPTIDRVRVANDVSFDMMSIADTQVYDGDTVNMWFLDRQGNEVTGFVNSDCIFVKVVDPDQDEDQLRRERIDGFWDGGQNLPFGPFALNEFVCDFEQSDSHPVNFELGDTNIFNNGEYAKIYVLNPRNGRWAAMDLLETGVATGTFVSVICIDLTNVYTCVPTLGVLPGDTIIAVYQDPSNHSDSAWISVKVGIGGGGTPPTQASTAMFVDELGNEVGNYTDADEIFVKVIDPSHAGATVLADAVEIGGITFDLAPLAGAQNDTFITDALSLGVAAGDTITATYTDPTDPTDTSSDTITIIASVLDVVEFYAGPSPFETDTTFGFVGTGVASVFSVEIYDLAGNMVWAQELANVTEIVWNGTDFSGAMLANGAYIYVIMATDGTNTFNGEGTVFINR